MDMTMFYVLVIVVGVLGITYLVTYLRKNNIVNLEDLQLVQDLFKLTLAIIDELNIKNEDKIMQISNIVLSALEYATVVSGDGELIIKLAIDKSYEMCKQLNIELTENRKLIITQLVTVGLANRYELNERNSTYTLKINL